MGKICILDIDIQGVHNIKNSELDCRYIFVTPPSMDALEQRLRGRATETEDKIKMRMDTAVEEMKFGTARGNFDAVITNESLEKAYDDILGMLRQWYPDVEF